MTFLQYAFRTENLVFLLCVFVLSETCPCSEPSDCLPLGVNFEKEVFIFSLNKDNFKKYDFDHVTTIAATYGTDIEPDLVCFAHSKKTRVVFMSNFPLGNLTHPETFQPWVDEQIKILENRMLDGVNIDFEDPIAKEDEASREGLNKLMQMLTDQIKTKNRNYQVSFDFAWSPDCIDVRCFDFLTLASIVDYSFIMSYDERSQIFGPCIAWANSPYNQTKAGIDRFLQLGIPPNKMILGVPWYGYIYECIKYDSETDTCSIKPIPFRGVPCSDASGKEINIDTILSQYLPLSPSKQKWDNRSKTLYFSWKDSNSTYHQIWYDDPESLSIKYNLAKHLGMAGVGMWNADAVDYDQSSTTYTVTQKMWQAFPFVKP